MMAAYRLRGLGWAGGCAVVTLCFYLVSLQVAAERKRLEQVDGRIAAAERDVRALETEFDTRASLSQLERWNGDTLSLVAPTARQFVRSEAQLASLRFDGGAPVVQVQTAALVVPAFTAQGVAPVVPATAPAPASVVTVKAVAAAAAPAITPAARPVLARAAPSRVGPIPAALVTVRAVGAPARRGQAVAMLDRGLLSDATIGDLVSGARSEAGRLR